MIDIKLNPGEHALIGYGSLLSIASMERTLGHKYSGPWHVIRLVGWRRAWDVQMPGSEWAYVDGSRTVTAKRVVYLNVRQQANGHVNCSLFVITTEQLERFDKREGVYYRANVSADIEGMRVTGGNAWVYVGLDEYLWRKPSQPPEAIIRRSYLDILESAHTELGDEFRREYHATTDALPGELVVDDIPN